MTDEETSLQPGADLVIDGQRIGRVLSVDGTRVVVDTDSGQSLLRGAANAFLAQQAMQQAMAERVRRDIGSIPMVSVEEARGVAASREAAFEQAGRDMIARARPIRIPEGFNYYDGADMDPHVAAMMSAIQPAINLEQATPEELEQIQEAFLEASEEEETSSDEIQAAYARGATANQIAELDRRARIRRLREELARLEGEPSQEVSQRPKGRMVDV